MPKNPYGRLLVLQPVVGTFAMSIMRCKGHAPRRATRDYVAAVEPVGFPHTALVCGSKHCREPALIWLERSEKTEYDAGERIFQSFTATMKVRAKD